MAIKMSDYILLKKIKFRLKMINFGVFMLL